MNLPVGDERGNGTVFTGAAAVLLLVGVLGLTWLLGYLLVTHQLRAAADVSALAAARQMQRAGPDQACAQARAVAQDNEVELADCSVAGDQVEFVVTVTVQRKVTWPGGKKLMVEATAHAGRVDHRAS